MTELRTYQDEQSAQNQKFEEGDPDRPLYVEAENNIYDYEVDLFDDAYYEAPRDDAGYLKIPDITADNGDDYMKIPEAETEDAGYLKIPDIAADDGNDYLKLDGIFEDDWALLENEYGDEAQDAINQFIEHTAPKDDLKLQKDDMGAETEIDAQYKPMSMDSVAAFEHHQEAVIHQEAALI